MGKTFDYILTFGAIIVGILMLTGNGSIFLGGGDTQGRKRIYDEKKMEKACGIAVILIGILTGIDTFTTGMAAKIIYVILILVIFVALVFYIKTKCKK